MLAELVGFDSHHFPKDPLEHGATGPFCCEIGPRLEEVGKGVGARAKGRQRTRQRRKAGWRAWTGRAATPMEMRAWTAAATAAGPRWSGSTSFVLKCFRMAKFDGNRNVSGAVI